MLKPVFLLSFNILRRRPPNPPLMLIYVFFVSLLLPASLLYSQSLPSAAIGSPPSISFEQWLSLRQPGNAILSPDGASIAFTVTSTDWKENAYDAEIWLSRNGAAPIQLTRT